MKYFEEKITFWISEIFQIYVFRKYKKFQKYNIGKLKYFEKVTFRNHENTSKLWNICTIK